MKLSVITVNYNNRIGLERTIQSVINQLGFDDFEYLVIDGGSTDGSKSIIEQYSSQIDYWVSEPDEGVYNAMNKGVKVAKGKYCIFMNSGDCFYNNKVLCQVSRYLSDNIDVVIGSTISRGNVKRSPKDLTALTLFKLPVGTSVCHQSTFTRTALLKTLPYEEKYKLFADRAFLTYQLIINNRTYLSINEIICEYEGGGMSAMNWKTMEIEKETYLHTILPERIFVDYQLFSELVKNSALLSLLSKYEYSGKDITLIEQFLRLIQKTKLWKTKMTNFLKK